MAHRARSREEWRRLVAEFETSELSAEAFARKHDVGASTLTWWRSRLRHEHPSAASPGGEALVPFVRVVVAEPVGVGAPADGPRLELPGGLLLRFAGGSDAEYVAAVVASTATRLVRSDGRC